VKLEIYDADCLSEELQSTNPFEEKGFEAGYLFAF
jgi:hypothetical protein